MEVAFKPGLAVAASTLVPAAMPSPWRRLGKPVQTMCQEPPSAVQEATQESFGYLQAMPSILVVDDQPDVLETSTELLRILGYEVFSAGSGEAALRVLREFRGIEILLTDVVMPHMDGLTLAQHARRGAPGIKVILMSGYAVPEVHAAIRDDDRTVFLSKPFNVPDLARVLRL